MASRFLSVLALALLLASPGLAGAAASDGGSGAMPPMTGTSAPGQDLVLTPPSEECGPASAAPCPPPGQAEPGRTPPGASASKAPAVGAAAPAFRLQDLDDKTYAFSPKALAKPTLMIFWSLFCEPCREEFPTYGKLAKEYGPKGLDTVAVNLDGPKMAKTAKSYLKSLGMTLRVVMDRKEGSRFVAADPYAVVGTPSLFLVDRGGTIRWLHAGRIPPDQLRAEIQKVLGP